MHNRWYDVAVVVLWLTTMGWLVTEKVLPALWVGDAPDSRTILAAAQTDTVVAWSLLWEGRRTGWALNSTGPSAGGMMEMRSRVHFDEMPLGRSGPGWLRNLVGQLGSHLQLELDSTLAFDGLGRLSRFDSTARFPPSEEAAIKVRGSIDGAQLMLAVRSGDFNYETQLPAPRNALMGDAFSPQTHLPGLREGQSWTIAVYSPLQPPNPNNPKDPREILHATVEGREPTLWGGQPTMAWVVVYRSDTATATHQEAKPAGKVWVRPDGVILKQQVVFFGTTLTFLRLSDAQATALAKQVRFNP